MRENPSVKNVAFAALNVFLAASFLNSAYEKIMAYRDTHMISPLVWGIFFVVGAATQIHAVISRLKNR